MLRLVSLLFITALLVAPLGFGGVTSEVVTVIARALFVVLLVSLVVLSVAGAKWSRRWPLQSTSR